MSINPFVLPVEVVVDPFGKSPDERPNIYIQDAIGVNLLIVVKHPVWDHLEKARMGLAQEIARLINDNPPPERSS